MQNRKANLIITSAMTQQPSATEMSESQTHLKLCRPFRSRTPNNDDFYQTVRLNFDLYQISGKNCDQLTVVSKKYFSIFALQLS